MDRKRVTLLVTMDLDPVPGAFHTESSAVDQTQRIMSQMIPHYNPEVLVAPDSLQPSSTSRGINNS